MTAIDGDFVTRTLQDLVRTPSINPDLCGGSSDEAAIGALAGARLEALGAAVEAFSFAPRRPSVVGRLRGSGGGPTLLLYAHYDTVNVLGMDDPFSGEVRDGRLYGRGAYDMKCGLAACFGALEALRRGPPLAGDVCVAAVADEETESRGMAAVLDRVRFNAAIVTEPTDLRLCVAHKGFVWLEVEVRGRAAHGSRFREGVDANLRMGRFLARLEALERELRARSPHPLLETGSLHVGELRGGSGPSTYADRAMATIERRTLPGETVEGVEAEIEALLAAIRSEDPELDVRLRTTLARNAFEAGGGSRIVPIVAEALAAVTGTAPTPAGESYWMDAALLAGAGVDTVVLGAKGAGAHAAVEWAELDSVLTVAEVLRSSATAYCGTA
ncbi:MAG: M20/M25/M40 family metallo-hydrolase [Gemmatimonadales bacterium]